MKLGNALIVYTIPRNNEQKSTLERIKGAVKKHSVSYSLANRDRMDKGLFAGKDIVIAAGGDGTFLRAAQFTGSQLLLGVNADVKDKEGFFMKADKNNFEAKLAEIMDGNFRTIKLPRLEARLNGKKIEALALNEFFIGSRKAYHAAKYTIEISKRKERQKSSGIIISTPAGSNAWAKGCCGKTMPLGSEGYQFVVREPYEGQVFKNYKFRYGILKNSQKIRIVSEMLDGILIADSVGKEYGFRNGSIAEIGLSKKHLNAVWD
ncbi:NAD(+)/NADH kinase [Candidatus Woesearchaeota archaeon]|nr:NAD(+)/NADH kinase [Candidatus Woesearchaeota archaeon]